MNKTKKAIRQHNRITVMEDNLMRLRESVKVIKQYIREEREELQYQLSGLTPGEVEEYGELTGWIE